MVDSLWQCPGRNDSKSSVVFPSQTSCDRIMQQPQLAMSNTSACSYQFFRDQIMQDRLFSIIVEALTALFNMNSLDKLAEPLLEAFEDLLTEHYTLGMMSRLHSLVPGINRFFTTLPFSQGFRIYNAKYRITKRKFIPPTFHEIRHIMNITQILAVKHCLRLISFDGDETLYPDGKNFEDITTACYITTLLLRGCKVAIVTAAGYGYQTEMYEQRLVGLLCNFRKQELPEHIVENLFIFGGESNYLLRCASDYHLKRVNEDIWQCHLSENLRKHFRKISDADLPLSQEQSDVSRLMRIVRDTFEETIHDLGLKATIIEKERAIGLVTNGIHGNLTRYKDYGSDHKKIKPEVLEETVYRVKDMVNKADPPIMVPFCAFNGGQDVWVDVGNKAEGLMVLQSFLKVQPQECLYIGDQFRTSGNDTILRNVAPTLWVSDPSETKAVLRYILKQVKTQTIF